MNEEIDFRGQVPDAPKGAPPDRLLGDDVEPNLDLVQPGGVGRCQVDMETRMRGQPAPDPGVLVSGVVVDDQVDLEVSRDVGVDVLQEAEKLLVTMPLFALGEDLAGNDIERGKEGQGAVPDVVVGHPLDIAQPHRQNRLRPVQSLDLALFVDAEDHGVFRGIQIQADNVPDLFDEKGIGRDLEVALAVRLQAERAPDPLDRRGGNGGLLGHRADGPLGPAPGLCLERPADELGDLLVGDGAGTSGTQLVMQAGEAPFQVALPPQGERLGTVVDLGGDLPIAQALGRHEDDLGPRDQIVGHGSRAGDGVQVPGSLLAQHDRPSEPSCSHGRPPSGWAHDSNKNLYSSVIYVT